MSLKPLKTEFQGRQITLECTHKKKFPPPQMYGHSAEDVDKMWKQGAVSQTLHQSLTVWKDMCGLFVMEAKCLSCPQALLQKPRPGRPNVIETENFLEAKKRFRLEDARDNRTLPEDRETPEQPEPSENPPRATPKIVSGNPNLGLAGTKVQQDFEAEREAAVAELQEKMAAEEETPKKGFMKRGDAVPATVHAPSEEETLPGMLHAGGDDVDSLDGPADETIEAPQEEDEGLDDDVIAALADD